MFGDLNCTDLDMLILFYLKESGYLHTAYCLKKEGNFSFQLDKKYRFPPGLLISLIQRGIVYSQIETDFSLFSSKFFRSPFENSFFTRKSELEFDPKGKLGLSDKEKKISFLDHKFPIQALIWHPRKLTCFFGTKISELTRWSLDLPKQKKIVSPMIVPFFSKTKDSLKEKILFMDFNPIGTLLAAGTFSGCLLVFTENGKILKRDSSHLGPTFKLKWTENSKLIVAADLFGKISIWSSWYCKFLLKISLVLKTPAGFFWIEKRNLLIWSKNQRMLFLDFKDKILLNFKAHPSEINGATFSEKENLLAICSGEGEISIWGFNLIFQFLFKLHGHHREISEILFKPIKFNKIEKRGIVFLMSSSLDGSVKLWNLKTLGYAVGFKEKIPVFSFTLAPSDFDLLIGGPGEITMLKDFEKKFFSIELKSKMGIFTLLSHSMVNKFLGCTLNTIFYC